MDDFCDAPVLQHEIGHAVGLRHEQARADRDFYLTVNFENIDKRRINDSIQQLQNASDSGPYDYGSLMQYGRFASTRGIQMVTQVTIPAGMVIGEWGKGFTAEDIDTVFRMYGQPPATTAVETNPPGLQVVVDRVAITGVSRFCGPLHLFTP